MDKKIIEGVESTVSEEVFVEEVSDFEATMEEGPEEEFTAIEPKSTTKHLEVIREQLDFRELMKGAEMLAKSTIIPVAYQRKPENCFVALDMASGMGLSPLVVMQNLYVIQGKPSWSGQAIASMLKASPLFKDIELVYVGQEGKDSWGAYVTATKNGKRIKGGTVTLGTAKAEGWYQKSGSKWKTMPELMLAYRAYAWFGRVHAPEMMMGLQSTEEVVDVATEPIKDEELNPFDKKVK